MLHNFLNFHIIFISYFCTNFLEMKYLALIILAFSLHSVKAQTIPFNDEQQLFQEQLLHSFIVDDIAIPVETIEAELKWTTVPNYTFGKDRGSIAMIADLDALHPYFRDQIIQLMQICRSQGIQLAIVESFRTSTKQDEYKGMGKDYTRSKGGRSKHQYGLAIDVVPMVDSVAQWHDRALWKKIGLVGEQLGLKWGGRWRHLYDPGHFEWTGGLTTVHLSQGKFPLVPRPEKYPCLEHDLQQLISQWTAWEAEQAMVSRRENNNISKGE
jgi:hypothetical protein